MIRKCECGCGREVWGERETRRYAEDGCRTRAYRARQRAEREHQRVYRPFGNDRPEWMRGLVPGSEEAIEAFKRRWET